jgi:hypothetical protein
MALRLSPTSFNGSACLIEPIDLPMPWWTFLDPCPPAGGAHPATLAARGSRWPMDAEHRSVARNELNLSFSVDSHDREGLGPGCFFHEAVHGWVPGDHRGWQAGEDALVRHLSRSDAAQASEA